MADQDYNAGELPELDLDYEPEGPEEGVVQDPGYDPAIERVREALGIPHIEAMSEDLMAAEADRLADEFPELREQENAEALIAATNEAAVRLGVPSDSPRFLELARMVHASQTNPKAQAKHEITTGGEFLDAISGRDQGLGARCLPF